MRQLVTDARVARLATVSPAGGPQLVPIVFALADDRLVSGVDAKPKSGRPLARFANVAANPAVSVLIDFYDDDWSRLWWVRLDGHARVQSQVPDDLLALLVDKYPQYQSQPPTGPFLVIEIKRWTGWSAVV